MGNRGPKPVDLAELQFIEERWWEAFRFLRDGYRMPSERRWQFNPPKPKRTNASVVGKVVSQRDEEVNISGRPDLWQALQRARKIEDVRRLCSQWQRWLGKITEEASFKPKSSAALDFGDVMWPGKFPAPEYIKEHAQEFLAAKRDKRFPRKRKTADDARLDYLARAMAGILCGRTPATGVDRLRRIRHDANSEEHVAKCWRCQVKVEREREKLSNRTLRSFLASLPELQGVALDQKLLDETPASSREDMERKSAFADQAFWIARRRYRSVSRLEVIEIDAEHYKVKYMDASGGVHVEILDLAREAKNEKPV